MYKQATGVPGQMNVLATKKPWDQETEYETQGFFKGEAACVWIYWSLVNQ